MDKAKFAKYFQSGGNFWLTNPNPRAQGRRAIVWDTGDCCIRALANAVSCSWLDAYDYLSTRARRDFSVPNDSKGFRKWLIEGGGKWTYCPAVKGKTRMTVLDFAKAHPIGRYVVKIANHEVAVVDGTILDAWNCGEHAVVGYIDMANFKL